MIHNLKDDFTGAEAVIRFHGASVVTHKKHLLYETISHGTPFPHGLK